MDTNQPAEELRARQRAHRRRIVELEREAARLHALRSLEYAGLYEVTEQIGRVSDGLNDIELAFKSVQAEAAAELRVSDLTVSRRMHARLSLAEYPVLIDALEKGDVSQAHASVIISAGDIVEEALRTDYETLVVDYATKNSVSRTRHTRSEWRNVSRRPPSKSVTRKRCAAEASSCAKKQTAWRNCAS